MTQNF